MGGGKGKSKNSWVQRETEQWLDGRKKEFLDIPGDTDIRSSPGSDFRPSHESA